MLIQPVKEQGIFEARQQVSKSIVADGCTEATSLILKKNVVGLHSLLLWTSRALGRLLFLVLQPVECVKIELRRQTRLEEPSAGGGCFLTITKGLGSGLAAEALPSFVRLACWPGTETNVRTKLVGAGLHSWLWVLCGQGSVLPLAFEEQCLCSTARSLLGSSSLPSSRHRRAGAEMRRTSP